jgi:hypothetical protein
MTLEACKCDLGKIFYVEQGNPKGKFDDFKWCKEFKKASDKAVYYFNDPNKDPKAAYFPL